MLKKLCITLIFSVLAAAQALQPGAVLPQIKGTSLEEHEVTLPDASAGKVTLLICTFTKAAGEQARGWTEHFIKDYPQDDRATSYSIAFLEDVPSLFRGMARGGIKRGTPAALRSRFLTVTHNEADWKRYLSVTSDNDTYLLLLDSKSRVQWMGRGAFQQTTYDAMKAKITELATGMPSKGKP